jgi:hypothetical protein
MSSKCYFSLTFLRKASEVLEAKPLRKHLYLKNYKIVGEHAMAIVERADRLII